MKVEQRNKKAALLEQMWKAEFPKSRSLTQAERRVLAAVTTGGVAYCGPSNKDDDPLNNPAHAGQWKQDRQIGAELVRWLCTSNRSRALLNEGGIRVHGARIADELDLSNTVVPSALLFWNCSFDEGVNITSLEVPELDFARSWIRSCRADRIRVKGAVFLRDCHVQGEVSLVNAEIGSLECDGAKFINPPKESESSSGEALSADSMSVKGAVHLGKCHVQGKVRMLNAQIGGNLECDGAEFINPPKENVLNSGVALDLAGAFVKGYVFLRDNFYVQGEANLIGCRIGATLECSRAQFINSTKNALFLARGVIAMDVFLDDGFYAEGDVDLSGTHIGGLLDLCNATFKTKLNLHETVVGTLKDNKSNWPDQEHLILDGLVYRSIVPSEVCLRLNWLNLQPKNSFLPQPYLQLAKVLGDEGDEDGRIKVLMAMKDREWSRRGVIELPCKWLFKATIGYGYHPLWAFWEIVGLTTLGWILYRKSYLAGEIVPADKNAYKEFKSSSLHPSHQKFSPLIYSLENSLPLVKLGQVDKWQPDPSPDALAAKPTGKPTLSRPMHWPSFLPWLYKFLIYLGLQSHAGRIPQRAYGGFFGYRFSWGGCWRPCS